MASALSASLIKNNENRPFPSFSPDLAFYWKIWLFHAQKWISLKKLGTLLDNLCGKMSAKYQLLLGILRHRGLNLESARQVKAQHYNAGLVLNFART